MGAGIAYDHLIRLRKCDLKHAIHDELHSSVSGARTRPAHPELACGAVNYPASEGRQQGLRRDQEGSTTALRGSGGGAP